MGACVDAFYVKGVGKRLSPFQEIRCHVRWKWVKGRLHKKVNSTVVGADAGTRNDPLLNDKLSVTMTRPSMSILFHERNHYFY